MSKQNDNQHALNGNAPLTATSSKRDVKAEPPVVEETDVKLGETKSYAGGVPAVTSAMKHALGQMTVTNTAKTLLAVNQKDGFDCPSCAWADPDADRSIGEFCENGVKAVSEEATKKCIGRDFFAKWSVEELSRKSDYWLGKQGRLAEPMILRKGKSHYEPISWGDAFEVIAKELNALASPNEAVFYTSGRTSNEAAFLYQLFVRQFGTNNLPDCSNMCHESSGVALKSTVGVGKGTVSLHDVEHADVIFVVGQNPGTNHPRMLTALQEAKRNGAKIVSVNPLPEAGLQRFKHPQEVVGVVGKGTKLSDMFLQVRINGDVALYKGILKEIFEEEERRPGQVLNHKFISEKTIGFEELRENIARERWSDITEQSGIARERIKEAAQLAMSAKRLITCWAMGLTQHKNAVDNVQEVVNLHLLLGQVGNGGGLCPVRGHSNVQGDRTMGIYEKPAEAFLAKLDQTFNFMSPRAHGYDVVESILAMAEGKVNVFFCMGGNFLSATPDSNYTGKALQNCKLTVQVSTKLNRSHVVTGETALILPCLGRTEKDRQASGEQFVTVENSMSVVSISKGVLEPASPHLKSEVAIVAGLAKATLGSRSAVDWDTLASNYDHIRDLIERVVPGFENFNQRIRDQKTFVLPNCVRDGWFDTPDRKARFTTHRLPKLNLAKDQFLMMTIRTHDQFNTTIYGLDDRYRGIYNGRRVVMLNRSDMDEFGFKEGQWVDLTSHFEGQTRLGRRFMVVPFDIPKRCAATYFPESNVLVPVQSVAEKSGTPTSKSVVITIAPTKYADADLADEVKALQEEFSE